MNIVSFFVQPLIRGGSVSFHSKRKVWVTFPIAPSYTYWPESPVNICMLFTSYVLTITWGKNCSVASIGGCFFNGIGLCSGDGSLWNATQNNFEMWLTTSLCLLKPNFNIYTCGHKKSQWLFNLIFGWKCVLLYGRVLIMKCREWQKKKYSLFPFSVTLNIR